MKTALEELIEENRKIIDRRPDLLIRGDFTKDGKRYLNNKLKMKKIYDLPVRLEVDKCNCNNRIVRDQYEIKFCAWCHKEIE